MAHVVVQLQWPEGVELPPDAVARVTVEDATQADASSVVLGETVLDNVDATTTTVADVEVPEVDPNALMIARVHVMPGGRRGLDVERGDLISTQSHPVLTRGHGDSVVVPLTAVG
jgi:hypothetical protein